MSDRTGQVRLRGPWDAVRIQQFLEQERSPLRLAVNGRDGFPIVASLWFRAEAGRLWCATHSRALVTRLLERDNRVAFEVSVNEPPYLGVRGQARVEQLPRAGAEVLEQLLRRYLGGTESGLAQWLLSRSSDEVALALDPIWMTSWDFSDRMPAGRPRG